jgi:Nucleoside-diphosphate-sugar epimerases
VKQVLVTGAAGFIGSSLCGWLAQQGYVVRGTLRCQDQRLAERKPPENTHYVCVGDIDSWTRWSDALQGVEVVLHLASRVHVMRESDPDPLAAFRRVNVAGTERLAREAIATGVRRLVYVSSVKVNGEHTTEQPFSTRDVAQPQDPYAVSKWEAEQVLRRLASKSGLEVVIVRPPLVYGPGVGGNFLRLLKLVDRGVPLPLVGEFNRRSLVSVFNLCDLLKQCLEHRRAAGQIFLVSDGEDLSTVELIRRLARAMGKPARLFPIPEPLLRLLGRVTGKSAEVNRLWGSLQVDISMTQHHLGWEPSVSVEEGLARTIRWYLASRERS